MNDYSQKLFLVGKKALLLPVLLLGICFILSDQKTITPNQTQATGLIELFPKYKPNLLDIHHIDLRIASTAWKATFSNKPISQKIYRPTQFIFDSYPEKLRGEYRIRGSHGWHWDKRKPSIRVRLKGKKQIFGRQTLDFVNPEDSSMLANVIGDYLANKIALPSTKTLFATISINKNFKGLYHFSEQVDPYMLKRFGLGPFPIVHGNARKASMWKESKLWECFSKNKKDEEIICSELNNLLEIIQPPLSMNKLNQFEKMVDLTMLAKWSAFMTLIGSLHTDDFHNHLYAFDLKRHKFIPIANDTIGFGVLTSIANKNTQADIELPIYEFLTPVLNAAFKIPKFHFMRNNELIKLINGPCRYEFVEQTVQKIISKISPIWLKESFCGALTNIPELGFPIRLPVNHSQQFKDAERFLNYYKKRIQFIEANLNECKVQIESISAPVSLEGNTYFPFKLLIKGHSSAFIKVSDDKKLLLDNNFNNSFEIAEKTKAEKVFFHPVLQKGSYNKTPWLLINKRVFKFILEPGTQSYLIAIKATSQPEAREWLQNNLKNAITNRPTKIIENELIPSIDTEFHPWRFSSHD